eukprot:scaffold131985_cov69-Phaeocystis_antarctica.AAC.2
MHLQALSPKVVDGQPVVEHKVARDAVEVAGQPDGKGERDDPARATAAARRTRRHLRNLQQGWKRGTTARVLAYF